MREGKAAEYLGEELENVVLRGKLTLGPWQDGLGWEHTAPEYDDPAATIGSNGSNNHAPEAMGTRYSINFRERNWDRERAATAFFAKSRLMFLGSELDSTIYTYMVAHAVLEVCHVARKIGATATASEAFAWLQYLAARCEMFRSPRTKRIVTCGDRSADLLGAGEKSWQDRFADVGMGRRQWNSEAILSARAEIVREAFAPMKSGARRPLDLLRELGFRTLVPVRVAEWPNGMAVWRNGSRWNGNTQPVCGGREEAGAEDYAPANRGRGASGHRNKGTPTVTETPTGIRYESPVYPSVTLALPPRDQRTLDVEIGGVGYVRDLLSGIPEPGPEVPPPVVPGTPKPPKRRKPWWRFW